MLEVAVGTGRNLPYYPDGVGSPAWTGRRPCSASHASARPPSPRADLRQGDAQALDFPDESFDTVLCALGLCAIPDDRRAVTEMARVLPRRPLLLAVHVAACSLPLDAAVDCYGAFVTGAPPEGMPLKVGPIKHLTKDLSCPLLGLFGADDQYPSPDQVNELEEELKAQGKTYEFHSYEGAGHAFFSVNRTAYRPEAAVDGWEKIFTWFGRYLAS